jgi:dipeptidyl aminopeptidase/acylaminoacyl peptidase
MKNFLLAPLAGALLSLVLANPGQAAGTEVLTAEKMWTLQRLGDPTLSPDGRIAVVPVTRYDVAENKGLTDLWLVPLDGGAPRPLTTDAASDSSPVFSPDGRRVAFVSKRGDDKESQIYVIAVDGGEARRVTNVPTGADTPKWFPDGKRIAFVSRIWMDLALWPDQGKRKKEREDSKVKAQVWSRAPIAYWDHFLDDREPHVFYIAVDTENAEPVAITRLSGYSLSRSTYDGESYAVSPDGDELAFAANMDRAGNDPNFDVLTIPTCGCKPARNLTEANKADDGTPSYSPDGRWLAYGQQTTRGFYADRRRLKLIDRRSGEVRDLSGSWDRSADGLHWLPDSSGLLGSIDDAATYRIWRFDVGGKAPRALTTNPSFTGLDVAKRGSGGLRIIALRQSFDEPATLVEVDPVKGDARKLTSFNDLALGALKLGKVESVTYSGARGDPIQMWVVYPPDFDPSRKYPVYMLLHGGPHNGVANAVQWRWNAHVFAGWGYIVTWHNFHGSSGFGQEFADSINPDSISMPYEDTIKAAEWLIAKPYVDRDRMAAGGGSYGGFLASTLLGRPHPFRTLVAHAAVYNEFTQIAADYGAEKARFFEFWEKPEEFARYSPHTSAANFRTPTLVIHGQLDLRVPVNNGFELFNTLQKRDVPSKLLYFPDENHWVLKPQNSLLWYQTKKDWLATYVPAGAR